MKIKCGNTELATDSNHNIKEFMDLVLTIEKKRIRTVRDARIKERVTQHVG